MKSFVRLENSIQGKVVVSVEQNSPKQSAIILAAGDGKRMKSSKPKVVCEVLFKPMIGWVIDACAEAGICDICMVVGNGSEMVEAILPTGVKTVLQTERRGTGHAVMMAKEFLEPMRGSDVLILCGDAPFIDAGTISGAYECHKQAGNAATIVTAHLADPTGYGRIVRDQQGAVCAIVEQADASGEQKAIQEVNSGALWFNVDFLLASFDEMTTANAQGEYYLTDTVRIALKQGRTVGGHMAACADVVLGANDRAGLSRLNRIARDRELERHMANGVEFPLTDGVIIAKDVMVGADTVILPGTILKGNTAIGSDCVIGPNSVIENSTIGNGCIVNATCIADSVLDDQVKIGPFSNVRPGCHLHSGVKIGDFVEVKNSTVGEKTAIAHLTYVGDSDVGGGVNFGCGVVTVNYDGQNKFRTVIGNDCFIGCNTNLIAPVTLGDGVYSAAGTTITGDVPAGALVIGRAKEVIKEDWAAKNQKFNKK